MSLRQLPPGHRSRAIGESAQSAVDAACAWYAARGAAQIRRMETGSRRAGARWVPLRSPVDYWGTISGGRSIVFDVKAVTGPTFPISHLAKHQRRELEAVEEMGGVSGLLIEFIGRGWFWAPTLWFPTRGSLKPETAYRVPATGGMPRFLETAIERAS